MFNETIAGRRKTLLSSIHLNEPLLFHFFPLSFSNHSVVRFPSRLRCDRLSSRSAVECPPSLYFYPVTAGGSSFLCRSSPAVSATWLRASKRKMARLAKWKFCQQAGSSSLPAPSKICMNTAAVRSGAEERRFSGARLDVLIVKLRSCHVPISYSAECSGPKFHKTLMFLGQAGTFLSFEARRSSAKRSSILL